MLRGTVYVVDSSGTQINRHVWEVSNTDDEDVFKRTVMARLMELYIGDAPSVEFGPIGAPWPLRSMSTRRDEH